MPSLPPSGVLVSAGSPCKQKIKTRMNPKEKKEVKEGKRIKKIKKY